MLLVDPVHTQERFNAADVGQLAIPGGDYSAMQVSTGIGDGRYRVEGRLVDGVFGLRLGEIRVRFLDEHGNWPWRRSTLGGKRGVIVNEAVDDFFTDDLLDERKQQRKRKADGKRKGNRTELELAKIFNKRFGGGFSRSVGSGNRWGQVTFLPKHAQEVFSGDLIVPKGFKWALESKGGYADLDLNSVFVGGNSELDGFLDQVTKDGQRCGRKPMLCWKRDRKPWLAFVPTNELDGHSFEYRLAYKEWSAVALDGLLKLPDSFFLGEYCDEKG
jgi:hypothetical protein